VHGAWHGSWCFSDVVSALEARGHTAEAVDLPCDELGLTQHDYAAIVGPRPGSIVVGHSLGGQTIPLVEARTRVYLAAILPVENVYEESFAEGFGGYVRDELGRSYWPDADTCAAGMYPDCTREVSDRAFARLRPQAPFDSIVAPFGRGDVVLATRRDRAVDFDWQVRTAKAHGARVIELDAGHSPFLTQPEELADVLASLA
jgi:predicted alpha/beta hydrolase family esterase